MHTYPRHLVGGHVIPPLLRPLPVLFLCAEQTAANAPPWPSPLGKAYRRHRLCLSALLEVATRLASIPSEESADLRRCIDSLPQRLSPTLVQRLDALDLELAHFSEVHRTALREAYNANPELFRTVYRECVTPWKVALIYHSEEREEAPKLLETLRDRCYYDVRSAEDDYLSGMAQWAELVVFAPRKEPIAPEAIALLRRRRLPFIVLINLGSGAPGVDIEQLRLAALYQRNQIPTLHRPFPAVRLFQRIDRDLLVHRLQLVTRASAEARPRRA